MNSPLQLNIIFGYDQELIYEGFNRIIKSKTKYKLLGGWQNGKHLLEELSTTSADLLILEFGNPSRCQLDYLKVVKNRFNPEKIITITSSTGFSVVRELLELDLGSIIFKDCSSDEFIKSMTKVASGENYYCSDVAKLLLSNYKQRSVPPCSLTKRENSVLYMIIEGKSNSRISNDLNISESTVKTHRRNIMTKLGAKSSIELFKIVCKDNHLYHVKSAFCKDCPYNIRWN